MSSSSSTCRSTAAHPRSASTLRCLGAATWSPTSCRCSADALSTARTRARTTCWSSSCPWSGRSSRGDAKASACSTPAEALPAPPARATGGSVARRARPSTEDGGREGEPGESRFPESSGEAGYVRQGAGDALPFLLPGSSSERYPRSRWRCIPMDALRSVAVVVLELLGAVLSASLVSAQTIKLSGALAPQLRAGNVTDY